MLTPPPKKKKKQIQVLETVYLKKLLRISYLKKKTNDWMLIKMMFIAGPTGISSRYCRETETRMVRTCHA